MSEATIIPSRHDIDQTAVILDCSNKTIYRAVERGELGHFKIAGRIYCSNEHIAQYLRRCERPARVAVDAGSLVAA